MTVLGTREKPEPLLVSRTHAEIATAVTRLRAESQQPGRIALVPTMGALHEGHLALIREARQRADAVVVSIFVNPLQFGPGEDFAGYPRSFDADLEACREEGVAVVFAPSPDVIYPDEPVVTVHAGTMGERLEGASRPGHFDGVLTVVLKLFNLVEPDVALFGHKDAQQFALVRRMTRDLDVGVEIVAVPTVRERDGLAISSRNVYLSPAQRASALALSRSLEEGANRGGGGAAEIRATTIAVLDAEPGLDLDYVALVEPETFTEVATDYAGAAILAVAGWVGDTRLIDNVDVTVRAR